MKEKAALYYLNKCGFSVIPCGDNKKPLIKWQEFQTRRPTTEEVSEWFKKNPNANIGIVTGKVSNLAVIDIDEAQGYEEIKKYIPEDLKYPICRTPSGGHHYYFRMPIGRELRLNVRVVPGCDLRADGGYVVAAPSKSSKGVYVWEDGHNIKNVIIPQIPESYVEFVMSTNVHNVSTNVGNVHKCPQTLFQKGRRDNDLFHVAHCLTRGFMPPEEIFEVLHILGEHCKFPPEEIEIKVKSALERSAKRERNLAEEVREFVMSTSGHFLSTDVHRCLQLSTRPDMKNVSEILRRLSAENIIEKVGNKNGQYRLIDTILEEIDWLSAEEDEFKLELPLGINKYVKIMPKNLIVVAGAPNAGKTAFLLDIVFKNMHCNKINYFSSEMSNTELKGRLKAFGQPLDFWRNKNFVAYDRCSNFADVIQPNDVNIIDFLEIHDEFWKVGGLLKELYEKLDKGICIIAIQKKRGSDTGKGGDVTREKPRLYLTMDNGEIVIEKGKNWRHEEVNPNGLKCNFKLVHGSKFMESSTWTYKDGRELVYPSPYAKTYHDEDLPL